MALRDATQRWASGRGRSAKVSTLPSGASTRRTGAGEVINIIGHPRSTKAPAEAGANRLRPVNRSASERGPAPYCSGQGRGVGDMFRLAGEFLGQAYSLCGPLTCKDGGKPCCDVDLPSALIYSWITNSGGCTGELGNRRAI